MKVFCVISHTHWDREWYLPLESMRLRLCDLIDHCLEILSEQQDYIFHLDAQTIVLEDYLSIRTNKRDMLKKFISSGRLIVGPWYQQNDFYLTSGESTVRNLLEGHRMSKEFGGCLKAGYAPDQFGNISQLPQILANFDIDNFIFGRGFNTLLPDGSVAPSEFIWEGADGTQALAIHLRCWYNNAQHFSTDIDNAKLLIDWNEKCFEGVAVTPYILLMNGVDHLEAQPDLLPVLSELNKIQSEGKTVRQYHMKDYLDDVKRYICDNNIKLRVYHGEFRKGGDGILKGTLSSRSYLKASNVKAQTMLENRLEPLYSMMAFAGANDVYSLDHFRFMWKQLLQNHPHDSICGCSCDEVHTHMEDNYARLETTMRDMLNRGMQFAAVHLNTNGMTADNNIIAVANTTQKKSGGVIEIIVDMPKTEGFDGIEITDGNGIAADYMILSKQDAIRDCLSPLNLPGNIDVDRYRIYLNSVDIESFAIKGYVVNGTHQSNVIEETVIQNSAVMENDFLSVTVDSDGRVTLFSKVLNRKFDNVLDIEDTCDFGDSYIYNSDGIQIYGSSFPAVVNVIQNNRMVSEISIVREMHLPAGYDFIHKCRQAETEVTRVELRLKITAGSEHLEINSSVDNQSCDHRLRLLVNTDLMSETALADIPFDIIVHTDADHAINTTSKVFPNSTFAVLEKDGHGFAVMTEGAHEFEHLEDKKALAFTLVRSTGVIARNGAAPEQPVSAQWTAPGNQCLRKIKGRFALLPYAGDLIRAEIPVKSVQFRAGLDALFTSCDETKFMRGRAIVQDSIIREYFYLPDPHKELRIPDNQSLITVGGEGVLVTALKKAEDEQGIVLRAINLSDGETTIKMCTTGEICETTMSEECTEHLSSNTWHEMMGAKKVKTYKIV